MTLGRLIARVAVGGLFAGHGAQKLFGWFGGSGVEGTAQTMHKLELRPAKQHALAAGAAQTPGGAPLAPRAPPPPPRPVIVGPKVTPPPQGHPPQRPRDNPGRPPDN